MFMIYTYIIKGDLTDLNTYINAERRNRFIASKLKKENTELVSLQTKNKIKIHESEYPLHVHLLFTIKNNKKDRDNIAFAKKFILDGLKDSGIVDNDGAKQISTFSDDYVLGENESVSVFLIPKTSKIGNKIKDLFDFIYSNSV